MSSLCTTFHFGIVLWKIVSPLEMSDRGSLLAVAPVEGQSTAHDVKQAGIEVHLQLAPPEALSCFRQNFTVAWLDTHLLCLFLFLYHVWVNVRVIGSNARPKWDGRVAAFLSCLLHSSAGRLWCKVITEVWILLMIYTDFWCLFIKKKVIYSTMDVVQNIYFLSQNTQSWVHCSLLGGTTAAPLSQKLWNKNKQVSSHSIEIRKNI